MQADIPSIHDPAHDPAASTVPTPVTHASDVHATDMYMDAGAAMDACLLQFVQRHGNFQASSQTLSAFLAAHRMAQILPESAPEEALLQKIRFAVQKRAQNRLISAMQLVLTHFQARGIRCLFLKGPLLGLELYGETGIRPTSDLDIFVAEAQFGDALDVLTALGYTRKNGIPYAKEDAVYELHRGDARLHRIKRHVTAVKHTGSESVVVELHVSVFRHYAALSPDGIADQTDLLFADCRFVRYGGISYPVLGIPDSFLMLCTHFARHLVERTTAFCVSQTPAQLPLRILHDLARFYALHMPELDGFSLLNRAKRFGCCADLAMACRYLSEIYHINLWQSIQCSLNQIAAADSDFENDLYWAVTSHLSAAELFFGSMSKNLSVLKPLIPPRCFYHCQSGANPTGISDDCPVQETFDCPDKAALRDAFSFRFGVGWSEQHLTFHVSFPMARVSFLEGCPKSFRKTCTESTCQKSCAGRSCANTSIRLLLPGTQCPQTAGSCMNVYEISILKTPEGLLPFAEQNDRRVDCPICLSSESDGRFHLRFQLPNPSLPDAESCRFMISREILLPYAHKTEQAVSFSLGWIDNSVAVSHTTCFSCGLLQKADLKNVHAKVRQQEQNNN